MKPGSRALSSGAVGNGITDLLGGWSPAGAGKPRKRSLAIAGHRTSISLEEPFWEGLRAAAQEMRVPLARLVAEIDAVRGKTSLSSAIRLYVLEHPPGGKADHDRDGSGRVVDATGIEPVTPRV